MQALGMIEVIGLPPAIEAADSALKAANVTLLSIAKADAGILTVEITGDVGAVIAAVDAGAAAAERVGTLRAKHVIPHVDESLVGKVLIKGTKLFQPKKKVTIPISQNVNSRSSISQEDGVKEVDRGPLMDKGFESKDIESDTESKESITDSKGFVPEGQEPVTNNEKSRIDNEASGAIIENSTTQNVEFENESKEYPTITSKKDSIEGNLETKNKEPETQKTEPITTYTVTDLKKKSNDALRAILQSQGVELTDLHKSAKKQELIQLIIAQQNRR